MMQFSQLPSICQGHLLQLAEDRAVETLVMDSRKAVVSEGSLFFAIKGDRHDGHSFIREMYSAGLRQFIVESEVDVKAFPKANVIRVDASLDALQKIATHHRRQFEIPVVGITGSNGKTIVKEWLYQTLSPDLQIAKNPGSYNSQVGVPLAVWTLQPHHQLGIFEAGISRPGEMEKLKNILRPTSGIFTNLGSSHDEGFSSRKEKAEEKAKLFTDCERVIYCKDHAEVDEVMTSKKIPSFTWGRSALADVVIQPAGDRILVKYKTEAFSIELPFSDQAALENAFHVTTFMIMKGYEPDVIQERIQLLRAVAMRLELKQGINRCLLIDDSYNNDLAGLHISLDFLKNQQKSKKTLILSDILQSGLPEEQLVRKIGEVVSAGALRLIGIGPVLWKHRSLFKDGTFYGSTSEFLINFRPEDFSDEVVLVKGARAFQFEKVVQRLERKVHGTVMEIDLNAVVQNLNHFKSLLNPGTKLMVMVKAFAYGSGSEEVANLLQYHRVDYLGVAYADEGVELRKNNITIPIMVMNPSEESFAALLEYNLEPEVYNLKILKALADFLGGRACSVHLKLDTGMHRLGFEEADLGEAIKILNKKDIRILSVFSHLSGADEKMHDAFSAAQADKFSRLADRVDKELGYRPLRHLVNSPGILRFPQYQFDMVRLGIGLYGVDPTEEGNAKLMPVATLKTVISQIKKIAPGETIGYGRKGKAEKEMTLATLAIGYADGFSRSFSRGKGKVLIHGQLAPVVGNVCMDMTMVDITGIAAREGDEVIVFGKDLPIRHVSGWIDTIPYELLTSTSERVKRVFYAESI